MGWVVTKRRLRVAALLALFLAAGLAATFPLALALRWSGIGGQGFSARGAEGSIWSGTVRGAALGAARLGDLDMSLSPLALLSGSAVFAFAPAGDAAAGPRGRIAASASRFSLGDVTAALPAIRVLPAFERDIALTLVNVDVRFEDGRCASAAGEVSASLPVSDLIPESGNPALAGAPVCDGERLLLPLTGRTAAGDVSLFIRVDGKGAYEYDLGLSAADPAVRARLAMAGLAADGGWYRLRGGGTL